MKKVLAILIVGILVCGIAFAQDAPAGNKQGAKSLNFMFGGLGNFGIGSPNTYGGVSVSYFLSGDAAVRAGLNIGYTSTSQDPPSTVVNGLKQETSDFAVALQTDYLMYMNSASSRVRPYFGGGILFGMMSGTEKNTTADEISTGGIELGVAGVIGAEFYIYNELSLSAEYSVNVIDLVMPSDTEVTNAGTTVKTPGVSKTTILGFRAVGAALHIYL